MLGTLSRAMLIAIGAPVTAGSCLKPLWAQFVVDCRQNSGWPWSCFRFLAVAGELF